MPDLTISISLDASGLTSGIREARSELESLARTRLDGLARQLKSLGESVQSAGQMISGVGQSLTQNITGPLLALGNSAVNTSAKFDSLKQGLIAIEGGTAGAEAALVRLREVAKLPGLGFTEAVQGYTNLRAAGVGAELAERSLTAFGNALATVGKGREDLNGVITALQQMQSKGKVSAEEINQISERLPQMRVAMKEAFGTADTEVLAKKGIDSEKFVNGIVTQLEKLPKANGGITAAFENISDTVELALKPIGDAINRLLVPAIEAVSPYIEQAAKYFENLSPAAQTFVIAIAAIAAAIGPVLLVIGAIVTGVGAFIAALSAIAAGSTFAIVIAAIGVAVGVLVAGIGIAIGVVYGLKEAWENGFGPIASIVAIAVGVIITAFAPILGLPILIGAVGMTIYQMWATNFGGLQEFTAVVWAKIQEYFAIAMAAIQQLVAEIGGDVVAWWQENYPLIQQTVQTVSDAVRAYIQNFLNAVKAFWDAHGEQIMSVVQSIWTIISTIVRTGVQVIMGIVRLVMQVINGDWAGAWNTAKDIVSKINTAIWTILKELGNIILQALKFVVTAIVNFGTDLFNKALEIGKNVVNGIINGISSIASKLLDYARNLILRMFGVMDKAAETNSPSLYTTRMGFFVGMGLVGGIIESTPFVIGAAKKMVDDSLGKMGKEAKKAVREFMDLAGSTAQQQKDIVTVANYGEGKSKLDELIKLRAELNRNVGQALPKTLSAVKDELEALGKQKQGLKDAADMLKQFDEQLLKIKNKDVRKTNVDKANELLNDPARNAGLAGKQNELLARANELDEKVRIEAITTARDKMNASMGATNKQLTDEVALLEAKKAKNFQMDAAEQQAFQQRLKNAEELRKFKEGLEKEGIGEKDVGALVEEMKRQQDAIEQLKLSRASLEAQDKLYTDTMAGMDKTLEQLNEKLTANTRKTNEDVLAKIRLTEAYAGLTAEQKKNLEDKAKEVRKKKAQAEDFEKAKKQMDEFKGFIKDSLNTLVNDGFGAMFKSILDKFKKMLIDMAIEWIASKFYKLIFKDGEGTGSGGGLSGILKSFLGIFGIGKKGTGSSSGGGSEGGDEAARVGSFGGMFDPIKPLIGGKNAPASALAGKLSGIGALATLAGSIIGGRVGGVISMAGTGMSIGAMIGGPWGAAIGAAAGAIVGLFMGDPKKKVDKKENMPKLQKGFTDAMQQLRDLLGDRNALFGDPDGAVAKAMEIRGQIAAGFGIEFQSKKYKKEAQKLIAAKLIEADQVIKQIKDMADTARMANKVDTRLNAEFAGGVFADRAFIRQHRDFKRRNGLLPGGWTGRDTLPSLLAAGEMVLNPRQIDRVRANAGFDAFRGAGIPNYATGTFVGGSSTAPAAGPAAQPVTVQIVLNNSGLVESDIKGVLVNGLKQPDVQVELVRAYDKGKTRARG